MPGVGNKTIEKLLNTFGTEMTILHKLTKDDLESEVGTKQANIIDESRKEKYIYKLEEAEYMENYK